MSNDQFIWDKLTAAGLTSAGAAGLLGNLDPESGLNPQNLQNSYEKKLGYTDADYTAAVDCGTYDGFVSDCAGYGIAQWTHSSRKAALLAFARARGASIGDLDMQVGYLIKELQSLFPALWRLLCSTASVREASDCVLLQFERPADQSQSNLDRRFAWAQEFYDKFAGGESVKLLKCMLTENECYQAGVKIKPVGVMVHSTGANNPTLRRYVQPVASTPGRAELLAQLGTNPNNNSWNQFRPGGTQVCVHAFVGKLADGSVAAVQTLPWDVRGWHSGYANRQSTTNANKMGYIGFEICEDGLTDPVYFQQVYQAAVELTAYLCKEYSLAPLADGVVICHQDGYQRGIASNHGDIYNWFPRHDKTMDDFRADVARVMKGEDDMTEEQVRKIVQDEWSRMMASMAGLAPSPWAEEELAAAVADGITDGSRPRSFPTREEVAVMVKRGMRQGGMTTLGKAGKLD